MPRVFALTSAHRWLRFEPRSDSPYGLNYAASSVPIRRRPGARLQVIVTLHAGNGNLPIIQLKPVLVQFKPSGGPTGRHIGSRTVT
jgi:hypothetical protein